MGEISVKGAVEKGVVKAESKGLLMKSMEGINLVLYGTQSQNYRFIGDFNPILQAFSQGAVLKKLRPGIPGLSCS